MRSGTNYTGVCSLCSMRYRGETGFNAHARIQSHEAQIRACSERSTMAQHLSQRHPSQKKNVEVFNFEVVTTGERPLTRQLREAQRIANDMASGQLINGRNEHIALAFQQLAPVDILNRDRGRGTGQ